MCSERTGVVRKDDGEQKPRILETRRQLRLDDQWECRSSEFSFQGFFVLSKLFSGLEQARARQRLRKHFGRGEIMRHPGNAQL